MDRIERYQTAYQSAHIVSTGYTKGTKFDLPQKKGHYPSGVIISPKNRANSANTLSLEMLDGTTMTCKLSTSTNREPMLLPLEVKAIAAGNTADADSLIFLYQA